MNAPQSVRIDHINIRTDELDRACAFYQRLLQLERTAPPGLDPEYYAWLRNGDGQPIIHIASPAEEGTNVDPAQGTGSLHHVAFACSDYAIWRERMDAMDLEVEVNDFPAARLRQLFVLDPDGIRLEFNFHDMPEAAFS